MSSKVYYDMIQSRVILEKEGIEEKGEYSWHGVL